MKSDLRWVGNSLLGFDIALARRPNTFGEADDLGPPWMGFPCGVYRSGCDHQSVPQPWVAG